MLCLNIRATNAMIGIKTEPGKLNQQSAPAKLSRDYEAPKAGIWPDYVKVDIDQYPCRKAYGYRTNWDSLHEFGQKGLQGVQEGVARRAREGTELLENGAKYNVIAAQAKRKITEHSDVRLQFQMIPKPEITVHIPEMRGNIDVGQDKMKIEPSSLKQEYTPTSVDTYIEQKQNLRMWTTEGKYDIYA